MQQQLGSERKQTAYKVLLPVITGIVNYMLEYLITNVHDLVFFLQESNIII